MSNAPTDRRSDGSGDGEQPQLGGRDRQREETHRKVFESSLMVFRRDGVNATKIEDIARAAGVSRGTFYFHFPTKDEVLIELFRNSEHRVATALQALGPETKLPALLDTICTLIANEWQHDPKIFPDVGMVALRVVSSLEEGVFNEPVLAALVPHFRAAAESGQLSDFLPAETLAEVLLVNVFAAALAWSSKPVAPLETVLRMAVQLFLHGAGRRPVEG